MTMTGDYQNCASLHSAPVNSAGGAWRATRGDDSARASSVSLTLDMVAIHLCPREGKAGNKEGGRGLFTLCVSISDPDNL